MVTLSGIKEDSVDEKQECLNVQILAPRQAQIEEELSETLIVNPQPIHLLLLLDLVVLSALPPGIQPLLLLIVHELLVLLIKLFRAAGVFLSVLVLIDLLQTARVLILLDLLLTLFAFLLLAFQINFPILFGRLSRRCLIEIEDQTLLDPHIQLDILLFAQSLIVVLLHEDEPLRQTPLEQ